MPILEASTGYVVSETAEWADSLDDPVTQAKGPYAVSTMSLLAGVFIILLGLDPIKVLFYSQIVNGVLGPLLVILILRRRIIAAAWENTPTGGLIRSSAGLPLS